MVGDNGRLKVVTKDLVEHFEKRTEAMDGKGMIVCMSRRICMGTTKLLPFGRTGTAKTMNSGS